MQLSGSTADKVFILVVPLGGSRLIFQRAQLLVLVYWGSLR